ncbi:MAG TPA: aldose epimerase family protein [Burkholderiales bacterium]|nr:aldose epimerase family protein [Burkholderiales bacterium]
MPHLENKPFGTAPDGTSIDLFILDNGRGVEARITNFGGIIVSLFAPDRYGHRRDILLGFQDALGFAQNKPYFGALIGRYANRIANARFVLDGRTVQLAANDGNNHLHGGIVGFDRVVWKARPLEEEGPALELKYHSPDGEEGYPGNLDVTVVYTLTLAGALEIRYEAVTDRPTPVNLTSHAYFNLGDSPDILGHELRLNASFFLPVNAGLIPTGELRKVDGTPFDFRLPAAIGPRLTADDEQLRLARGIDHTFVIDKKEGELATAAEVYDRASGRAMRVRTTEPGIQLYTGNFLDGTIVGKGGRAYRARAALCLEAQHFPDSPNQARFPSTILRPGEVYRQTTVYDFTAA